VVCWIRGQAEECFRGAPLFDPGGKGDRLSRQSVGGEGPGYLPQVGNGGWVISDSEDCQVRDDPESLVERGSFSFYLRP
jgi:hypothetical protein